MILNNLPALIIIIPLLAGLVTPFLRRGALAWGWVTLVAWACFAMSIGLLLQVHGKLPMWHGDPPGSYPMGSWKIPWAIEYRVDALNSFVLLIISGIAAVVTPLTRASIAKEIPADRQHFFYAIWLLCIVGLMGITITGDAFNVYVLLEVASLTAYGLVAMGKERDRRALSASMNYLVLGSIGACFILLGIGYLYMATGTLNMEDMARSLSKLYERWAAGDLAYRKTVVVGYCFLMVGFSLKLALFPLHGWLPNAYAYAPSAVSALLAATATKVGAYGAVRFMFTILGRSFCFEDMDTGLFLLIFAGLGVLVGSYVAIGQSNVKRLLAYSSIAQIGYIAMGIGLANPSGLQGALVHLFNHALTKGGLFLALAAVAYRVGGTDLVHLRGLGKRMPLTMAAMVAGGLGLVGVPLTSGFVSKWYLVSGAIQAGQLGLAVVVLAGSMLALVYVWRIIESIYFKPAAESAAGVREGPYSLVLASWILVGASLYFGIHASLSSELSAKAAQALLRGWP
jgi:multicomponent Na+:H+ antiporter subunit D